MEICGVSVAVVLLLLVLALLGVYLWRVSRVYTTLDKLGIKGPKPKLFVGNMDVMIKKGFTTSFVEWEKEYGKVYGIYRAMTPSLVVSDPDLIRELMVKNFQSFPNRQANRIGNYKPWSEMLLFLRDDHWKHVRAQLSPSFSSGKLKKMLPVLQRCCRNLVTHVTQKAETGEEVDAKTVSSAFTMDVIAGTGFGIEVDSLSNPDEPFVKVTNRILYPPNWMISVLLMLPSLAPYLRKIGIAVAPEQDTQWVMDVINRAMKDRRQETKSYPDILQLLVDAEKGFDPSQHSLVDAEIDHRQELHTSTAWTQRGLSEGEIQSNSFVFLLAGYETTASALSFLLFNLAANPECLEKAQKEVDDKLGEREVDYQVTNELTYVEMCINESLRLYPPGFLLDRECVEDTNLGAYPLKKNMLVTIPVYAIHTNPESWPHPMKFDPERHSPEAKATRHPFAFLPFGMGPRNCIGMRMAMVELKMAVAAILQKFSPVLCSKSVYPAKIAKHFRLGSEDILWIKFEVRQKEIQ